MHELSERVLTITNGFIYWENTKGKFFCLDIHGRFNEHPFIPEELYFCSPIWSDIKTLLLMLTPKYCDVK